MVNFATHQRTVTTSKSKEDHETVVNIFHDAAELGENATSTTICKLISRVDAQKLRTESYYDALKCLEKHLVEFNSSICKKEKFNYRKMHNYIIMQYAFIKKCAQTS